MRDVFVGAASKAVSSLGQRMPSVADKLLGRSMIKAQRSQYPARARRDSLWDAGDASSKDRYTDRHVRTFSLYTDMNTRWRALTLAGAGLAMMYAITVGVSRSHQKKKPG